MVALVLVTIGQVLRPGVNQDVRYVLGALDTAGAAGRGWTEVWAHRPLTSRAVMAVLDAVTPGEFFVREAVVRGWCVVIAVGAAVVLWRGLRRRCTPRVAAWTSIAVGAALAWAPGWDFAEPEWFAAALAVAAVGLALWRPRGDAADNPGAPVWATPAAGILLAIVVGLKFTTGATALAALIVITALDKDRGARTTFATVLAAPALFAATVLAEAREWQWLREMPTLNPDFGSGTLAELAEGLVNALVVSPITIVAVVAIGWLLTQGSTGRRAALIAFVVLGVLTAPFLIQQQNFLYHLAAVPVASAAVTAAVAAHADRIPLALPVTGVAGLLAGAGLFAAMGPRTRSQNWWVAAVVVTIVLVIGLGLVIVR
ncbi:MAG: hypothetical protein Q4F67_04855, partial [Propionibacteriaceae bacterium]|nr:hypothetical protein [Propionibacteriaceae bacterium]